MFFFFPMGVDYRAHRYPVVTFTLIGINTLVYLLCFIAAVTRGPEAVNWMLGNLWLIPGQSSWPAYVTTLFVHAGLFHLLGNMVYLYLFGSCVEDLIGRGKYILFYLLGGLAADFAHIMATAHQASHDLPLGGASGAVSACIGGFVVILHRSKINFKYFIFIFIRFWTGEFWLPAWLVISFWFASDFFFMVLNMINEEIGQGVAFGAHVGGFVSGFIMIAAFNQFEKWREGKSGEVEAAPSVLKVPRATVLPTIYLYENGSQYGPYTREQVQQMVAMSSVSPEALYWREGMTEWRNVLELTN